MHGYHLTNQLKHNLPGPSRISDLASVGWGLRTHLPTLPGDATGTRLGELLSQYTACNPWVGLWPCGALTAAWASGCCPTHRWQPLSMGLVGTCTAVGDAGALHFLGLILLSLLPHSAYRTTEVAHRDFSSSFSISEYNSTLQESLYR